jgi:hypothetical protein
MLERSVPCRPFSHLAKCHKRVFVAGKISCAPNVGCAKSPYSVELVYRDLLI